MLYTYCFITNKKNSINYIIHIMHEKYWNVEGDKDFASVVNEDSSKFFQNLMHVFSNKQPAFGVERLIYSTVPTARCLSALLTSEYVVR